MAIGPGRRGILAALALGVGVVSSSAQDMLPAPRKTQPAPFDLAIPRIAAEDRPLPINLATALALAQARPVDILLASQRLQQALAQEQKANTLWLPTVYFGVDYHRHDGQVQSVEGNVFGTSKQSLMVGAGPSAVFAFADALYAPLAARQDVAARQSGVQTAQNDALYAVAESYFNVQQARGELAAALDAVERAGELVRRTEKLAPGLILPVEASRARAELARRRQVLSAARERWRVASAQLTRFLRLDPLTRVEPLEPPHAKVTLVAPGTPVETLIPLALTNRPELATQQALVQATLARMRQEKMRPLLPSLMFRSTSTPQGTLGAGVFGGGIGSDMSHFAGRSDFDVQLVWELQNLGLGNAARTRERRADNQIALLEMLQLQDRIAAEVMQAHAQAQEAAERITESQAGLEDALDSADKNLEGMSQTRRVGEAVLLVIRPQEVVASVQALNQAYADFYTAIADYDRAQFRLYRALGRPAQALSGDTRCP
jgi:outer membrane protein TolC